MSGLLLDTHAFLWFIMGDTQLIPAAQSQIMDLSREKYVSLVSIWEIGIKSSLGKLNLTQPFIDLIPEQMSLNGFEYLNIKFEHIAQMTELPFHHRDPFDRLLIAQSFIEDMPILSCDGIFDRYSVQRIWN